METHFNPSYLVLTCRDGIIEQQILFKEGKNNLPEDVDAQFDETTGENYIKVSKKIIVRNISRGPYFWDNLKTIMMKGGDLTPIRSKGNHVAARIARIRRQFGDSYSKGSFFITVKNPTKGIRWNTKKSWRIIQADQPDADPTAGISKPKESIDY
jgi:hypothetical protein